MFQLNGLTFLLLLFCYIHIISVIFSIYCHRSLSHQAVSFHPVIVKIFRFVLWLTVGVQNNFKTASHRQHHRYTDITGDPHSVHVSGFYRIFLIRILSTIKMFLTFADINRDKPNDYPSTYSVNYLDDYTILYPRLGRILFLIINLILFGINGLFLVVAILVLVPIIFMGVIDVGCHTIGYRTYRRNDQTGNLPFTFFLTGGEEFHHNHHQFPSSAKLSIRWFEIDIGWMYIRLLQWVNLATITKKIFDYGNQKTSTK